MATRTMKEIMWANQDKRQVDLQCDWSLVFITRKSGVSGSYCTWSKVPENLVYIATTIHSQKHQKCG